MKKFNIFLSSASKKDYTNSEPSPAPPGVDGTIVRIVAKKEGKKLKWQKEQEEFNRRKREHDLHLLSIERHEIERREEELRSKKETFEQKRRAHREIEDLLTMQIRTLNHTLEEYRLEHKQVEDDLEDEIAVMKDCLTKVENELETRVRGLDDVFDKTPSKSSTIKQEFARRSVPCCLQNTDYPSFSVNYPKLPMSEDLLTLVNSTRIVEEQEQKQNGNRLSLNTNVVNDHN